MAFKKVSGARRYYKYNECKPGQKLVDAGVYVGPEEGKFGTQHVFKQQNGEIVVLNSAGQLNWQLDNYATPGATLCNVFYAGKNMLTKGAFKGKEAHNFELEVDDEYTGAKVRHAESAPEVALTADDITL
jgi:hypothetical protein